MRRREFITLIGGAAVIWALGARAQQPGISVIGFLSSRSPGESADLVAAIRQGLQETGFVEGQNVVIAFRWAEGAYDRLPELAADLVSLKVAAVITAGGVPAALAAKAATSTIPVVFAAAYEPDRAGLVASFNRPSGNVTGMSLFAAGLGGKSIELLKELVPTAAVIAYLVPVLSASTERDLEEAFSALAKVGARGLIVSGQPFFLRERDKIVALAARNTIPTIYNFREYVVAGGLMSYGTSLADSYRRAGIYVGRILKGAKPADLPVMQPTKFEMVINLKTAKALDLTIPDRLLAIADEVIE